MRRLLLLVVSAVVLAGAGPGLKKGAGGRKAPAAIPTLKRSGAGPGNSFLRQGSNRAAVMSFRKQLKANPDHPSLHVGLGKALARIGTCDEALAELGPWVGTVPFGGDAALAASTCSSRLGLIEDALYYDALAVELDPTSARALTNLALDLDEYGDVVRRDEALESLMLLRRDRDGSFYARAVLALRAGDIDGFDAIVLGWSREDATSLDLRRLQALAWLDIDDPQAAVDLLKTVRSLKGGKQIRHLRAEALRRTGYPEESEDNLEDRPQSVLEGTDVDAIRARVLADLGDVAGARELLADYDDSDDPDLLASQWYLAWRTGDAEGQARLAARYARAQTSPLRTLAQLVPVGERQR